MRPALLLLLSAHSVLVACAPDPSPRIRAMQAEADPPQLWSIETGDGTGVRLCADTLIRTGFLHQRASADADLCQPLKPPVVKPGLVSMRCTLRGREYAVVNRAVGDPDRDMTVTFSMRSMDGDGLSLRQVRRYRLLGACPAGWDVGDATDRMGRRTVNAAR